MNGLIWIPRNIGCLISTVLSFHVLFHVSVSSKWFVAFWTFYICMVLLMFFMLVMVQKRSWSFFARPNKAHPLAWYCWCCVHSPFVISQVRLGSCLVLAICRVCTIKNFMRILCYVQFVTSEVLNKSTFGLEMFSTVRTQNLFANVLFMNSLSVSFQWSYCHTLIAHFTLSYLYNSYNWGLKTLEKELIGGIIGQLDSIFQRLQARFDLSMPLKVHVILHHYMDFFESFGETLLSYSDKITEAMHSQIRLFEDAHRCINNKKGSSSHAKIQHRSTVHINSINLRQKPLSC